jgi:hypothetical protein
MIRQFAICVLSITNLLGFQVAVSAGFPLEITQAQAISQVRGILNRNSGACRITHVQAVSASKVDVGWRVNARVKIAGKEENPVWIVSQSRSSVAQNQLAVEVENGCP